MFGDINNDRKPDVLLPDTAGNLRTIAGGQDPYGAPNAVVQAAPGAAPNWNGVQISHRGSLGRKTVDDLFAHEPGKAELYLYSNDNSGRLDGQANAPITKPATCVTPAGASIDCAAHGYGVTNWSKVTQIAALGSPTGDSGDTADKLPTTSLLFVENGRLWLGTAGSLNALTPQAVLLSANDTKWAGYDLLTPGRAQGTDFPTLWARSETDGTLHAFSVKGTAQAPDLTGFTNPAAGLVSGTIDPKVYPRVGSEGDLTGDGIPNLWAIDTNQQLVAFNGVGTATPFPTATGVSTTPSPWATSTCPRRSGS
ncbi:hypothetical protein [Streptomyces avidinii]